MYLRVKSACVSCCNVIVRANSGLIATLIQRYNACMYCQLGASLETSWFEGTGLPNSVLTSRIPRWL